MSDEDLDLLVTLDDPEDEIDVHQIESENMDFDGGHYPVVFSNGDWTCSLSTVTAVADGPMRGPNGNTLERATQKFEMGVCTVSRTRQGQIVEQKVFYDLAEMQK